MLERGGSPMNQRGIIAKAIVLFLLPLFLILANTQPAYPEDKDLITDAGNYTFNAPPGKNWEVKIEKEEDRVTFSKQPKSYFIRKLPLTTIHVVQNKVLQEKQNLSEEEIADDVRKNEEFGMFIGGPLSGKYILTDCKNDTVTIYDKKIYIMSYKNSGGSGFGKDKVGEFILHIYFPSEFKEKHIFYMIVIGEIHEIAKTKETDFAIVYPIINSLRSKE